MQRHDDIRTRMTELATAVKNVLPEEVLPQAPREAKKYVPSFAVMAIYDAQFSRYKRLFPVGRESEYYHWFKRPFFCDVVLSKILFDPDNGRIVDEFRKRSKSVTSTPGKKTIYEGDDEVMAIWYVVCSF